MERHYFDKRTFRRHIDKQDITLEDYEKHLKNLPDVSELIADDTEDDADAAHEGDASP